jgi:hypothetical protein
MNPNEYIKRFVSEEEVHRQFALIPATRRYIMEAIDVVNVLDYETGVVYIDCKSKLNPVLTDFNV